MDSRECSRVLIVCIGNGKTAQRHYMGNSNEWIINTPLLWANNDLNVLYGSPLFDDELADTAPECPFVVNGHTYSKCYYLADGIYPAWSAFVKSFSIARDEKCLQIKRVQEAARKDIERAFGVLQALFEIGTTAPSTLTATKLASPHKLNTQKNHYVGCLTWTKATV
ncbi:probable arabinosyltransferase ARAD1 [Tanacetum coccineum]